MPSNILKNRILKKLLLGPASLAVLSLIYPYGTALFKWIEDNGGGNYSGIMTCSTIPLETSVAIISTILLLHLLIILPILAGWARNALYLLISGALLISFGSGGWFLLMSYLYLLCEPVPYHEVILVPSMVVFFVLCAFVFIMYSKGRLDKIIKLNKHVYNFDSMEYYFSKPHVGLDGRGGNQVAVYIVGAAVLSAIFLGQFDSAATLHNPTPFVGIGFFIFTWCIGFLLVGVMCINQLYIAWYIYKVSRGKGETMYVAELWSDKQ